MILPFSTQLNGKPTYFVEKIWACLLKLDEELYSDYLLPDGRPEQIKSADYYKEFIPKMHSFRQDKKNRWKPGLIIDFFINNRTKDMFRFAPGIPVVSTQSIEIKYNHSNHALVYIDGRIYAFQGFSTSCDRKLKTLAQNDGFDTIEEFFEYFNTDFTGKIIHWTDKRY